MTKKNIPTPDVQPKEPCFEDAFMDVLSGYISLCLEATEGAVDVIYAFIYQSKGMRTFNAFFRKDGSLHYTNTCIHSSLVIPFLKAGTADIPKLIEVCDKHGQKCPHEVKMTYHVDTKKFDAAFEYRDYLSKDKIHPGSVFAAWFKEEESKSE